MLWLHNTLLKEKVLREKAGISNLMLLPHSAQNLVKPFSRQLSSQTDVRVAFSDSNPDRQVDAWQLISVNINRQRSLDMFTIKEKL